MQIPITPIRSECYALYPEYGIRSWRWTLDLWWEKERKGIGLTHNYITTKMTEWRPTAKYASLTFDRTPSLDYFAGYYDGEHRVLRLGFIVFAWGW